MCGSSSEHVTRAGNRTQCSGDYYFTYGNLKGPSLTVYSNYKGCFVATGTKKHAVCEMSQYIKLS